MLLTHQLLDCAHADATFVEAAEEISDQPPRDPKHDLSRIEEYAQLNTKRFALAIYTLAYILLLVIFVIVDSIWLAITVQSLYRPVLGELLVERLRIAPAICFYLLYPLGIGIFAVVPALKTGSMLSSIAYGAMFGLFTYATYDLTNFATLRHWNAQITLIDIAWGAFATGASAGLAYLITKSTAVHFGLTMH